jgi:hypothetical protein
MDQGAERLAQGQAAAARDVQRQAAAMVERGAQQAEDLAAALRAERGPAEAPEQAQDPAGDPPAATRPLAAARAAMRQAAQQLDPAQGQGQGQGQGQAQGGNAAQAARQAMQQAARDLRAAARRGTPAPGQGAANSAMAQGQGQAAPGAPAPGTPGESDVGDPQGTLAGTGTPDLTELKATIARKTGRAWGELPGHLRTEILQMSQGRYRDDYARLIQLYFREIASGAAKPD